jgi:hypothetical protein
VTALGLLGLAMAGVFAGFVVEGAFPALPRWAAFAFTEAAALTWYLGASIREEAETPAWGRRGEALERLGAGLGAVVFAVVLGLSFGVDLRGGARFTRGMVSGGLALSILLAAASLGRERLLGTSLLHEARVIASAAPVWRRAWAALRILGEWTFVVLVGAAFTGTGALLLLHPERSGGRPWFSLLATAFFAVVLVAGVLMARQRWRALVPSSGPGRTLLPRRPGLVRRYRLDADGLVEYRRGVEVRFGWEHLRGVALGELAHHLAVFVRADVEPGVRAARPAQAPRWVRRRLREAGRTRALAGAEIVVMAFQSDLPLAELRERIARGIGAGDEPPAGA